MFKWQKNITETRWTKKIAYLCNNKKSPIHEAVIERSIDYENKVKLDALRFIGTQAGNICKQLSKIEDAKEFTTDDDLMPSVRYNSFRRKMA